MAQFFKAAKKITQNLPKAVEVNTTHLDINGDGVAKWQGKPLFVHGALANEKVVVNIIEQKSKYARARVVSVNQKSADRIEPKCQYFGRCGGCQLQHLHYDAQINFKQAKIAELFQRQGYVEPLPWQPALLAEQWHYRRRCRIGVQFTKDKQVILGFRQQQTNTLTDISHCDVLQNELSAAIQPLKDLFSNKQFYRVIGHVELIYVEQVVVVIRHLKNLNDVMLNVIKAAAIENQWHVLLDDGKQVSWLTTEQALRLTISQNIQLAFTPGDFFQVNKRLNDAMINQAINWLDIKQTDNILDLFCGLGNFSLPMAKQCATLVGVEGVQQMVDKANQNAKLNRLENCRFYQANINQNWHNQIWAQQHYHKILLDPARAGAYEACQQLAQSNASKVLYISCNPATLVRDAQQLLAFGYRITKIAMIDMFAQTSHVETMCLFEK